MGKRNNFNVRVRYQYPDGLRATLLTIANADTKRDAEQEARRDIKAVVPGCRILSVDCSNMGRFLNTDNLQINADFKLTAWDNR